MVWDLDKIDNTTLGHWVRATLEMCVTSGDYSRGDDVRIEPLVEQPPQEELDV